MSPQLCVRLIKIRYVCKNFRSYINAIVNLIYKMKQCIQINDNHNKTMLDNYKNLILIDFRKKKLTFALVTIIIKNIYRRN